MREDKTRQGEPRQDKARHDKTKGEQSHTIHSASKAQPQQRFAQTTATPICNSHNNNSSNNTNNANNNPHVTNNSLPTTHRGTCIIRSSLALILLLNSS